MNKRNMFVSGVIMLGVLTVFSGCSFSKGEDKNPQETVNSAIDNLENQKSGNYEMTLNGNATGSGSPEVGFKELMLNLAASGSFDSKVVDNPKFTVKMNLGLTVDGGAKQGVAGELALLDKNFYFKVNELSEIGALASFKSVLDQVLNKWWYLPLPPDVLAEFEKLAKDEKDLSPEDKKLRELFKNTNFFIDAKYEGEEEAGGVSAGKYSVKLDEVAMKKYVEEVSKIENSALGSGELVDMQEFFELLNFSGTMWIDRDDNMLVKMEGDFSVIPSEKTDNLAVNMKLSYTLSDLNEDIELKAPEGATLFDIMMLLGGLEAGGPSAEAGDAEAAEEVDTEEAVDTEAAVE